MTATAAAIYEKGVLRPLSPLPLAEGARVEVTVTDEAGAYQKVTHGRTGAELARLWAAMPHLSTDEAAAFEEDLTTARVAEEGQPAPKWE